MNRNKSEHNNNDIEEISFNTEMKTTIDTSNNNVKSTLHKDKIKTGFMSSQTDACTKYMDDYNTAAFHCFKKDGLEAALKHMFTDQDSGKPLSYSEMRARYG